MPPGLHSPGAAHSALGQRRDTAPTTAPLSRRREGARCVCQSAPSGHRPYARSFAPRINASPTGPVILPELPTP